MISLIQTGKTNGNSTKTLQSVLYISHGKVLFTKLLGTTPRLIFDKIDVILYPTILQPKGDDQGMSARTRRKVSLKSNRP